MSDKHRLVPRFTLVRPVTGQTMIVGQTLKVPCRLIDVSTSGARVELLPSADMADEISLRLSVPDMEIFSVFLQVHLGPWKMALSIKRVTPSANGYYIWGNYTRQPVVPVQELMNFAAPRVAFNNIGDNS